ncbi:hypothetical protein BDV96DRAFT_572024 [Lophiotrema nucula]|uniref:Uncharacterized protein n=1 Tax=Lophiotrema nucula TaxID=690887 RepID=A0A6A5ZGB1_9PLEO|nr:hypothetical protein BDV96DRAFT_572024 [Lophiotrema nucula]
MRIGLQDKVIGKNQNRPGKQASYIKKRKELQKEVEGLEWRLFERQRNLDQMNKALDGAIGTYAQTSCLQLTTNMSKTLPRELRDIVYSYILDEEEIGTVVQQVRLQLESECCTHAPCSFSIPLFMDTRFVPLPVAKEVLELIADHHARTPDIANTEVVPKSARQFLDMQALHLPVPVSRFFSESDLRIKLHLADLLPFLNFDIPDEEDSQLEILIESVRQILLDVPAHPNRVLTLELWEARSNGSEKEALRTGLLGTVEEIKRRGFKEVSIGWYSRRTS